MVRQRRWWFGYFAACVITMHTLAACSVSQTRVPGGMSGELSVLNDARFAREYVEQGVWTPEAFDRAARGGIYLVGEYDVNRVPVLFIHGMYGSPREFRYLIGKLDRDRFQAWVFYYPSGESLEGAAERLVQAIADASAHRVVHSMIMVAHSMGGLVARDALVHHSHQIEVTVPLLITLSTPWQGHGAARVGAALAPFAVASWHDLAIGSTYLKQLFTDESGKPRSLPATTQHHLLFSYRRKWSSFGFSSDAVVSVASQLHEPAQAQAHRVYGFDATHVGMLRDADVAAAISLILSTFAAERMAVDQRFSLGRASRFCAVAL